ncbi:uncharacterized protein LOC124823412 [Vigna umbellata]|uniref:uncharacterized protein LOC124823412 n=1 Tax=Vigna umbellata TaxID=87088 RepID=UPI001F5F0404|nr:uncharacterized protein LOC124823412 [Vigna umbellata]
MKKNSQGSWSDQCEKAFKEVKEILTEPPVMGRPEPGHELQLFLATMDKAVERVALALLNATRRLRPYFQGHQVVGRTDHPVAKILRKPDLADRVVGWSVELSEFGLRYEPCGSVRGQHLADFAELPTEEGRAEYEALLAGMELARDLGVEFLECRTDSQLVEGHMKGNFEVKDDQLLQYFHKAKQLEAQFKAVELKHIPREENVRADRLSKLAGKKEKGQLSSVIRQVLMKPTIDCLLVCNTVGQNDWRKEVIQLMKEQDGGVTLPMKERKKIARYIMVGEDLYRRGYTTPMMKCLSKEEAKYVMRELHEGICGRHTGGRVLKARTLRAGFFWPTMEKDCGDFAQKCVSCQKHGNVFNAPATELHGVVSPWPFAQWRMDIVGPFPIGRAQKKFLLVSVDYFTKWVEAEPLASISAAQKLVAFYKNLGITPVTSSVEHPQANRQAEAANKIIVQELKKRVGQAKGAWVDELPQVLWGYHCSPHGTTGESPFNLTYRTDAMLPVDIGEPTVRRQLGDMTLNEEQLRTNLDVVQERRDVVVVRTEA